MPAEKPLRLFSWNVNGLRAVLTKGFGDIFAAADADMYCLQETKLQEGQVTIDYPGYSVFWNCAEKKGYSGTAVLTRRRPVAVTRGIGREEHDHEGRVLTLEYEDFFLVCVYVPNSQTELKRLDYRMAWEEAFREYVTGLDRLKPVIICGDMNVAHQDIDLRNPKTNRHNPGFTDEERAAFTALLDAGFADTVRELNPDKQTFSWWSYRFQSRAKDIGWRIDYFLVSRRLMDSVTAADIHTDILGSDHCPVSITVKL